MRVWNYFWSSGVQITFNLRHPFPANLTSKPLGHFNQRTRNHRRARHHYIVINQQHFLFVWLI